MGTTSFLKQCSLAKALPWNHLWSFQPACYPRPIKSKFLRVGSSQQFFFLKLPHDSYDHPSSRNTVHKRAIKESRYTPLRFIKTEPALLHYSTGLVQSLLRGNCGMKENSWRNCEIINMGQSVRLFASLLSTEKCSKRTNCSHWECLLESLS